MVRCALINYLSRSSKEDGKKPLPAELVKEEGENDERESESGRPRCVFDPKHTKRYDLH